MEGWKKERGRSKALLKKKGNKREGRDLHP